MIQCTNMIEWQTFEHAPVQRGADWYFATGLIVVALAAALIIFGNVLLAAVIIIAFILTVAAGRKEPRQIRVRIDGEGVLIEDHLYPYDNLESFFVDKDREVLLLKSKKVFMPHIVVMLADYVEVGDISEVLEENLEEEEMYENVFELFMEYLGF